MDQQTEFPDVPDTIFTRDEVISFIRADRAAPAAPSPSQPRQIIAGLVSSQNLEGVTVTLRFDGHESAQAFMLNYGGTGPRMPANALKNLQTWLVCSTIGTALKPEFETIKRWVADLGAMIGSPSPWADNSQCKFASGGARCVSHCGDPACVVAAEVDESPDLHGKQVDAIAEMHGQVVDVEFPGTPTVAECIAQLDVWNGHLEAAIDRRAHRVLGQHPNDEPAGGRDPMEQLP